MAEGKTFFFSCFFYSQSYFSEMDTFANLDQAPSGQCTAYHCDLFGHLYTQLSIYTVAQLMASRCSK